MHPVLLYLRHTGSGSDKWYAILEVPKRGALCAWGRYPEAGRSQPVDERKAAAKRREKLDKGYVASSDPLPLQIRQAIEKAAGTWLGEDVKIQPVSHRVKITPHQTTPATRPAAARTATTYWNDEPLSEEWFAT